ncbi:hypothetical protein OS493_019854, partial [Desmophyllum pertusum]
MLEKENHAVTRATGVLGQPVFLHSRYGYKMCARLYLNGNGMGRGTHISVFFGYHARPLRRVTPLAIQIA